MADVEEINTDRGKPLQCGPRKSQKAIALNILITVDKDNQGKGEKKPCPACPPDNNNACCQQKPKKCCPKHGGTCGDPGASVPPPCLPPNSMVLPCGCLAMFDDAQSRYAAENMLGLRRSNNAGVQCAGKRTTDRGVCGKQEKQSCSAGCQTITRAPPAKEQISEPKRHYGHRKVHSTRSKTRTAAGSQTPATSIPKTKERMRSSRTDIRSGSRQASRTDIRQRSRTDLRTGPRQEPPVKRSASQVILPPPKPAQTTATQTSFSKEPPAKIELKATDKFLYEAPPKEVIPLPPPKESEIQQPPQPSAPPSTAPSENVVVVAKSEVVEAVPKDPSAIPVEKAPSIVPPKDPSAIPLENAASTVPPKDPSAIPLENAPPTVPISEVKLEKPASPGPSKEPSVVPVGKPASPVPSKQPSKTSVKDVAAPPLDAPKEPSTVPSQNAPAPTPAISVVKPYEPSEVAVQYVPSDMPQSAPAESAKGSQTNLGKGSQTTVAKGSQTSLAKGSQTSLAKGSQTNLTKQPSQADVNKASQSKTEAAPKGSQTDVAANKAEAPKAKSAIMVGYAMIENDPEPEPSTKPSGTEPAPVPTESTATTVKEPEPVPVPAESTAAVMEPEPPAPTPEPPAPASASTAAVSPSLPHFSKMEVNVPASIDVSGGDYQSVNLDDLLQNAQKEFADVRAIASSAARKSIDRQQGGFPPPSIEFSRTASKQNTINFRYGDHGDDDEDDRDDDEERDEDECDQDQEEEEDADEEGECDEDEEEADDEGGLSLSKLLTFDWNTWDRFVSLMNGEPIPNPCMNRCEEEDPCGEGDDENDNEDVDADEEQAGCSEEEEEECSASDGDGWSSGSGRRRSSGQYGDSRIETLSLMLQSDTQSQDTYILFIALPLVILGIMASFKECNSI